MCGRSACYFTNKEIQLQTGIQRWENQEAYHTCFNVSPTHYQPVIKEVTTCLIQAPKDLNDDLESEFDVSDFGSIDSLKDPVSKVENQVKQLSEESDPKIDFTQVIVMNSEYEHDSQDSKVVDVQDNIPIIDNQLILQTMVLLVPQIRNGD